MSRIKEVEDQIPKHLSKYVQNIMRKQPLKEYHERRSLLKETSK